jgi:hypothetical protein
MKKLVIALALVALPSMSFAAGIDMTWDDCVGGTPATAKTFNCTANANYNVHFQFKLPTALPSFVSATAFVDYQNSTGTPLSPFWRYEGGGCQIAPATDGIAISDDNSSSQVADGCKSVSNDGTLEDPWEGTGTGTESVNAYGVDFRRPGNGYLVLLDYRTAGDGVPLAGAPTNYWLFRLNFRTINRAACPGCEDSGVLLFQRLSLESNDGTPTLNLDNPDKMGTCLTINGGSPSLCPVVPVRNTSWGQLKSLYR